MSTTVEVFFDKEDRTFSAGDVIFGKVVAESEEEKNLKLIKATRVRCKGISTVDLKFGKDHEESGASLSTTQFINEDAKVFTEKLTTSKYKKGSVEMTRCEYPFKFTLSKDLPSSFRTSCGRMEYFFKATVPSGVAVSYFEGRGSFNVVGILDLNKRPEIKNPVELRQETAVKTLLSDNGKVSFCIRVPQKGYAIGERIKLHQEIVNNSKQAVTASISLIQKISYDFKILLRLDKENKIKVFGTEIAPNSTDICDNETFEIPLLPVTSVIKLKEEHKTVKIEYFLKYEVMAKPGWLTKFKGYIPLVIGSIPLKENASA